MSGNEHFSRIGNAGSGLICHFPCRRSVNLRKENRKLVTY